MAHETLKLWGDPSSTISNVVPGHGQGYRNRDRIEVREGEASRGFVKSNMLRRERSWSLSDSNAVDSSESAAARAFGQTNGESPLMSAPETVGPHSATNSVTTQGSMGVKAKL